VWKNSVTYADKQTCHRHSLGTILEAKTLDRIESRQRSESDSIRETEQINACNDSIGCRDVDRVAVASRASGGVAVGV
jgi:hypothetical protein